MKSPLSLFISIFMVSAAVGCSSSCASVAERLVEKPKIALSRVALQDVTPNTATVVFGVEVDNPNGFALKLDALRYELEIGGKAIGSGRIDKPAEVAAHSKGVVDVPVPVKFADLFSSFSDLMNKTTSDYRVRGEASFGLLSIPFDEKGEIKLR
ncbi:MAG: LEA type 2 family protein [Bdellovibrionota bacterium]